MSKSKKKGRMKQRKLDDRMRRAAKKARKNGPLGAMVLAGIAGLTGLGVALLTDRLRSRVRGAVAAGLGRFSSAGEERAGGEELSERDVDIARRNDARGAANGIITGDVGPV